MRYTGVAHLLRASANYYYSRTLLQNSLKAITCQLTALLGISTLLYVAALFRLIGVSKAMLLADHSVHVLMPSSILNLVSCAAQRAEHLGLTDYHVIVDHCSSVRPASYIAAEHIRELGEVYDLTLQLQ